MRVMFIVRHVLATPAVRQTVPAVLIGGLTGFALIGPMTHLFPGWAATPVPDAVATAQPTPRPTASATPASCYVHDGPAATLPQPLPAVPAPTAIWVNAPLGVNVRAAPDVNSQRLTGLAQGTRASVLGQRIGVDGALWYDVQPPGQPAGWVNGNYVVTTSIHTATTGEGWSLMLPDDYTLTRTGPGAAEGRNTTASAVPFLEVAAAAPDALDSAAPGPVELRHDVAWVQDHVTSASVWNYTPAVTVSRAAIDTCLVPDAAARHDGGWAWVSSLSVLTSNHRYFFLFISDRPADPLITQILASMDLS
jgi:hypothetical protein